MIDPQLDTEAIAAISTAITRRIKTIMSLFPQDKKYEFLLRNLASGAIHLGLFMRDLTNYLDGNDSRSPLKDEEKFLNECGCKDHKE